MIVSKEFATSLNKDILADMATQYATEFASKLGHKEKVIINPAEVIFDVKEAEHVFLKKLDPKNFNNLEKDALLLIKLQYDQLKKNIDKDAFVQGGVAYIPIRKMKDLNSMDKFILQALDKYPERNSNDNYSHLSQYIANHFRLGQNYVSIYGFGAEIGHLTGEKIYKDKIDHGMSETLDALSQLMEIEKSVMYLQERKNITSDSAAFISKEFQRLNKINFDYSLEIYETLLFSDKKNLEDKLKKGLHPVKKGIFDLLNLPLPSIFPLIIDYVQTRHYEGIKLFTEIYLSAWGNLDRTYALAGELFSRPDVTDVKTALKALGHSDDELTKYDKAFSNNIKERLELVVDKLGLNI